MPETEHILQMVSDRLDDVEAELSELHQRYLQQETSEAVLMRTEPFSTTPKYLQGEADENRWINYLSVRVYQESDTQVGVSFGCWWSHRPNWSDPLWVTGGSFPGPWGNPAGATTQYIVARWIISNVPYPPESPTVEITAEEEYPDIDATTRVLAKIHYNDSQKLDSIEQCREGDIYSDIEQFYHDEDTSVFPISDVTDFEQDDYYPWQYNAFWIRYTLRVMREGKVHEILDPLPHPTSFSLIFQEALVD